MARDGRNPWLVALSSPPGLRGSSITHVFSRLIRIAVGLTLSGVLLAAPSTPLTHGPGPVYAANCKLTLESGGASPSSGTTQTAIIFSVRVAYRKSCAAPQVRVTVVGLGSSPTPLSSGGSSTLGGTTTAAYNGSRTIDATGHWEYQFSARVVSDDPWVTLMGGSPTRVTISAPSTPPPTPKPTAKATPKPTARPTAKPTAAPTHRATPKPKAEPTAKPKPAATKPPASEPEATSPPEPTLAPEPSGAPAAPTTTDTPEATTHPITALVPGRTGGTPPPRRVEQVALMSPLGTGPDAGGLALVALVWVLCGVVGSVLFVYLLVRRTRGARAAPFAYAMSSAQSVTEPPPTPDSGQVVVRMRAAPVLDLEAGIPRWRRPSLQAARQSRGLPPAQPKEPLRFAVGTPTLDRRIVDYRMVRVADRPDDLDGEELGRLDRGDEVEVIQREKGFALVRAPDGLQGWVVASTLTEPPDQDVPEVDDSRFMTLEQLLSARAVERAGGAAAGEPEISAGSSEPKLAKPAKRLQPPQERRTRARNRMPPDA